MLQGKKNFKVGGVLKRLPLVCTGLLALLAVVMLCPPQTDSVNAEGSTGDVSLLAYNLPTTSIKMSKTVGAEIDPATGGGFAAAVADLQVAVSGSDKYSISVSATENSDEELHDANGHTIPSVASRVSSANMPVNTWGVAWYDVKKLGDWADGFETSKVSYSPVTVDPLTILGMNDNDAKTDNNAQGSSHYKLVFGAKVDLQKPAGNYVSNVTVTATASPSVLTNYSVTYYLNGAYGTVRPADTSDNNTAQYVDFTLPGAGNMKRAGWGLNGWSTNPNATPNSAEVHKPGTSITLNREASSGNLGPAVDLYAIWERTAFGGITDMKDMTKAACQAAPYGETTQLRDNRNGEKWYWVTKLADGNCWMTQNLDLNIPAGALEISTMTDSNNSDTARAGSWTSGNPTNTTNLTNDATASNTNSWDQGMYVYSTPQKSDSCGTGLAGISACTDGTTGKTFVNVESGWTASNDPDFTASTSYTLADGTKLTKTAGSPILENTAKNIHVYDAHYLIGNYYSFNAATAGTGSAAGMDTAGKSAASSICPAGWVLPLAGNDAAAGYENNNKSGSFYNLLNKQFGVLTDATLATTNGGSTPITTGAPNALLLRDDTGNPVSSLNSSQLLSSITWTTDKTINTALTSSPLFFVRSGYIGSSSALYYPGYGSYYWSRSSGSAGDAFYLAFTNARVYPSGSKYRYRGYSLRCLHP